MYSIYVVFLFIISPLSFSLELTPFLSFQFPTCILLCKKFYLLFNSLILLHSSTLFSCTLFIDLSTAIYYTQLFSPPQSLITFAVDEAHSLHRYKGDICNSPFACSFQVSSTKLANPILSRNYTDLKNTFLSTLLVSYSSTRYQISFFSSVCI
jgi:hypothetical protein